MGGTSKIPLEKATAYAERFEQFLYPYCKKIIVVGSVRRKCALVGDIELCCFPNEPDTLDKLFAKGFDGLTMNGNRLKRFIYPSLQFELYIPQAHDWGRIVAIRTGSSTFSSSKLAVTWNRLGWAGTSDGLRRKKECEKKGSTWKLLPEFKDNPTLPPEFPSEVSFFEFLGIPWVDPTERDWKSRDKSKNYS